MITLRCDLCQAHTGTLERLLHQCSQCHISLGSSAPQDGQSRGGGRGKGAGQQAAAGEGVRLLHSCSPLLPPAASNALGNGDGRALPPFAMPLPNKSTLFN